MLSAEEYREKFDQLINAIWTLQSRIDELSEFEQQWGDLFERLKIRTAKECRIHILNTEVYRGFRSDKYHVVTSDLLSILENEVQNEKSVVRQSIHHLKVFPIEHYSDPERITIFTDDNGVTSEDSERKSTADFFAQRIRDYHIGAMKEFYPRLGADNTPAKDHLTELLNGLSDMRKEIYSLRQIFAHKHQELIVAKHSAELDGKDIGAIKAINEKLFSIAQKIGNVHHRSSYAPIASGHCKGAVADQIDLILFGSINGMHARFYENLPADTYFWQAREKYYESEELLSVVAQDRT